MPLLLFLAIILPVFFVFWGGPIALFGLIKTNFFTGVYLAGDKKEKNLIKDNTYMIFMLVWTIISLFVFYNYLINYFL